MECLLQLSTELRQLNQINLALHAHISVQNSSTISILIHRILGWHHQIHLCIAESWAFRPADIGLRLQPMRLQESAIFCGLDFRCQPLQY